MIKQIRTTVHTTASSIGRTCLSAVIALCLALVNSALALGAPQVLVIATSELPPFVSAEPRESFLTELLPEVAKEMDVVFEFRFMPWPRCELAVDTLTRISHRSPASLADCAGYRHYRSLAAVTDQ
ncbi:MULTISPECIES: hypothetical protein [Pseudomonas]|uniref:hypothetical protein n=1 Tax=Pseudomonas TaxID=286 RepID=UPI0013150E29|nr:MULTISPECIES: hypothetical protein [Pseudomonas]